jgi:hypothetical protein
MQFLQLVRRKQQEFKAIPYASLQNVAVVSNVQVQKQLKWREPAGRWFQAKAANGAAGF